MIDPPDLFAPSDALAPPWRPISCGPTARVLAVVEPLPARSGDDVAWVRALLEEYSAAHDSERRARCYATKPTTAASERGDQTELYQKHLVRQERVVMALTQAVRCPCGKNV